MEKFCSLSLLICLFLQLFSVGHSWKNLDLLDLGSNMLEGSLPPSLCKMQSLKYLLISDNKLYGTIPDCFGNMSAQLTVLDLRKNKFHGKILANFPKANTLRNLGLNGNNLQGSLPRSLLNCKSLEVLDVGNNNITDTFPGWLGTLPELSVLIIKGNQFHGTIGSDPNSSFQKLQILDISYNQFNGSLPAEMLDRFEAMKKNGNQTQARYTGGDTYYEDSVTLVIKGLQVEVKRILTLYTTIDLSRNGFNRSIPKSIGELNSLQILNFSHNRFDGAIPSTIGDLSALESLDLSWNQLEGKIPPELAKLTFLGALNLSKNQLVGKIPEGQQLRTFTNTSYVGNFGLCGFPLEDCDKGPESVPGYQETDDRKFMDGFTWEAVLMGFGSGLIIGLVAGAIMLYTNKPKWFHVIVKDTLGLSRRKRRGGLNWDKMRKR